MGLSWSQTVSAGPTNVPPAGFEPAHPPPEGGALSPELRGLQGKQSYRTRTVALVRQSARRKLPMCTATPHAFSSSTTTR